MWRVHRKKGLKTTMWPSVGHALLRYSYEGCAKQHARGRQKCAGMERRKTINTFLSSSVFPHSLLYAFSFFFFLSLPLNGLEDQPSISHFFVCVSLYLSKAVLLHFLFSFILIFFARTHPSFEWWVTYHRFLWLLPAYASFPVSNDQKNESPR